MKKLKSRKQTIKNIFNLLILFLCMEVSKNLIAVMPELKILDMRLIFILIVSNYMGMKYGIASAFLASTSYIMENYGQMSELRVIFLNTNNWIPIAIYLILSIIVGLKSDKDSYKLRRCESDIKQLNREVRIANDKIERYENEIKEFNQILMTHNHSYITVSKFINGLEEYMNGNNNIDDLLKETLDNNSVEFIKMEELNKKLNRYFDANRFRKMKKEKIWINKNLEERLPCYVAPVILSENEIFTIVIWECELEQLNTAYRNKLLGIASITKQCFLKEEKGIKRDAV